MHHSKNLFSFFRFFTTKNIIQVIHGKRTVSGGLEILKTMQLSPSQYSAEQPLALEHPVAENHAVNRNLLEQQLEQGYWNQSLNSNDELSANDVCFAHVFEKSLFEQFFFWENVHLSNPFQLR